MIKVIKQGLFKQICGDCKSELEFNSSDICRNTKVNRDYLGGYDLADTIDCPICGSVVIVEYKKEV